MSDSIITKEFFGYCFQCKYSSNIKREFRTRSKCMKCQRTYEREYMRIYPLRNTHDHRKYYKYKTQTMLLLEELPIGLILD